MRWNRSPEERFWSKVDKRGPDECWEWKATSTRRGYGQILWHGRIAYAHRVSFEIATGQSPSEHVCHRCDNPRCVNPAHLFDAPQSVNLTDMSQKGRACRGSNKANAKLSESDIPVIRALVAWSGFSGHEVATEYGVSRSTVDRIIAGQRWRHA